MELVWVLGAYVLFIAVFLFIMLFGESPFFEGTAVQFAHVFVTSRSCELVQDSVERICGKRTARFCSLTCDAFVNKPNPILQIFYLGLIGGGWLLFASVALPLIPGPYVSAVHRYTAPLAVLGCLATFLLTSFCDPGVLTTSNVKTHLGSFKIDNQIYEDKVCGTCKLQRPARSKHCSTCNRCVARFDHHCAWMNTCIGEKNVRFFLAFLIGHALLCWYGAYVIAQILRGEIERRNLIPYVKAEGYLRPEDGWWGLTALLTQWLVAYYSNLVMLGAFTLVISLLLASFAGYHVYLVCTNKTTNETYKWAGYRRWLWEEAAAKSRKDAAAKTAKASRGAASDALQAAGDEDQKVNGVAVNGRETDSEGITNAEKNVESGSRKWFSWMRWRKYAGPTISIPEVRNIYDNGLLENVKEVLLPRSTRTRLKGD